MTHSVQVHEPERQAAPGQPPPRPPQRTAVGTDDEERRPCKHCGHRKTEHWAGHGCQGKGRIPIGPGSYSSSSGAVTITSSGGSTFSGTLQCGCSGYEPQDNR